jgi:hypothetical protein
MGDTDKIGSIFDIEKIVSLEKNRSYRLMKENRLLITKQSDYLPSENPLHLSSNHHAPTNTGERI